MISFNTDEMLHFIFICVIPVSWLVSYRSLLSLKLLAEKDGCNGGWVQILYLAFRGPGKFREV